MSEFWQRQAERKNMTEREYCIYKINEWKERLHNVDDEDWLGLSQEEFEKKIEEQTNNS